MSLKFRSIKVQIIMYMSIMVLVICIGLGLFSYNLAFSALNTSTNESLLKVTEQAADKV
ncbi:MAG: hypothetical protein K0S55_915, partial [Clostridia bacterium]|nr:hypothetical protein [Clostridia bacterium]